MEKTDARIELEKEKLEEISKQEAKKKTDRI